MVFWGGERWQVADVSGVPVGREVRSVLCVRADRWRIAEERAVYEG